MTILTCGIKLQLSPTGAHNAIKVRERYHVPFEVYKFHVLFFNFMNRCTLPRQRVKMHYADHYKGTWYTNLVMDRSYEQHTHNVKSYHLRRRLVTRVIAGNIAENAEGPVRRK